MNVAGGTIRHPSRLLGASAVTAVALWAAGCGAPDEGDGVEPETAVNQTTQGLRERRPRVAHGKPRSATVPAVARKDELIVKLVEGPRVRLSDRSFVLTDDDPERVRRLRRVSLNPRTERSALDALGRMLRSEPGVSVRRLFHERPESELEAEQADGESASGEELADLNLYFRVTVPESRSEAVLRALLASDVVETAYATPIPESAFPTFDVPPTTPNLTSGQGYLLAAPQGIDAVFAWAVPGGNGFGVRIIDVEGGFNLAHEDLPLAFPTYGVSCEWATDPIRSTVQHGTAVLGELAAGNNGYGVTGIAHGAGIGVSSTFDGTCISWNPPLAINRAAQALGAGDVLLIEQHYFWFAPPGVTCPCNCEQFGYVPVEFFAAEYDAIRAATARGVVVVEAAGNGSMNLDDPFYNNAFQRSFRDSGAILVGAGIPGSRTPECFSNSGSRVDLQGWGSGVTTTGYGVGACGIAPGGSDANQFYTSCFGGTSSASPIVAGAVADINGNRKARFLPPLNSTQMRSLLASTGSPQGATPPGQPVRNIGPQPNLRAAITSPSNR